MRSPDTMELISKPYGHLEIFDCPVAVAHVLALVVSLRQGRSQFDAGEDAVHDCIMRP